MKDQFLNLISLILVISDRFLVAVSRVAIAMGVLWLIGWLFPFVSAQLGFPQETVYEFLQSIVRALPFVN